MEDPKCPYCGLQMSSPTLPFHIVKCEKNPLNKRLEEPKAEEPKPKKK
jgi:hypothetical protein